MQVAVQAPPKRKTTKDDPERVEPKTTKELAESHMSDMLKSAGNARSQSIKLSLVAYGKDLADELLQYAVSVESLFKKMQKAVVDGDKKNLAKLLEEAKNKDAQGEKAKAWFQGSTPKLCSVKTSRLE